LKDAILEIVNLVRSTLEGKTKEVKVVLDRSINTFRIMKFDKRRLQQVILNLLSNAVKFTLEGTIVVTASLRSGSFFARECLLDITVQDKGIGMSWTEQSNVFEPFSKSDNVVSRNLNKHGNGVGLSICKKICESLGGNISVISEIGHGSTFSFTMKVFKVHVDVN